VTTYDYAIIIRTHRLLTDDEREAIIKAALEAAARVCGVPDGAPRVIERIARRREAEEAKTA
jgi:hypothetical protein